MVVQFHLTIGLGRLFVRRILGTHTCQQFAQRGGLSPSLHGQRYVSQLDRKRTLDGERKSAPKFKQRCLALKESRSAKQASREVLEGKTYSSGRGMALSKSSSSESAASTGRSDKHREISAPATLLLCRVVSGEENLFSLTLKQLLLVPTHILCKWQHLVEKQVSHNTSYLQMI